VSGRNCPQIKYIRIGPVDAIGSEEKLGWKKDREKIMRRNVIGALWCMATLVVPGFSQYKFTRIDPPPGASGFQVLSINNRGRILAISGHNKFVVARLTKAGEITEFRTLHFRFRDAEATLSVTNINDDNLIGGAIYHPHGHPDPDPDVHQDSSNGFVRLRSGVVKEYTIPKNPDSLILGNFIFSGAVNNLGHRAGVVEEFSQSLDHDTGFLINDAGTQILEYPGTGSFDGDTVATALNDLDQVVGFYSTASDPFGHGFLYDSTGGTYYQLDLPGAYSTVLTGINKQGDIVGWSQVPESDGSIGFVYRNGAFARLEVPRLDPNAPGVTVNIVTGINDDGIIVGNQGIVSPGQPVQRFGFVAVPVGADSNLMTRLENYRTSLPLVTGIPRSVLNVSLFLYGEQPTSMLPKKGLRQRLNSGSIAPANRMR
jgi:hypothetical protein